MKEEANKSQQEYEEYSSAYVSIGEKILQQNPFHRNFTSLVANMLPNPYRMVNLGSSNAKNSYIIAAEATSLGKEGVIVNVDPFINQEDVLKMTMEEYMAQCEGDSIDIVMCQLSYHFNVDQKGFFANVHRCLKQDGKMLITCCHADSVLYWGDKIQQYWLESFPDTAGLIPKELFEWKHEKHSATFQLAKADWKNMVVSRCWSHFLRASEE